jgi:RsiW-degrading membrane proteinase PrsW (M82 family)
MGFLLLALVPALAVLWFYYLQDRRREPHGLIAMTFGAGFCACAVAYPLERWAQQFFPQGRHLLLECLLIPGLIEESIKLLVVVLVVFWRADFDEPVDGLVYATAAALGFTFGEDWRYYVVHGVDGTRILSTAAHPWFSCFWGAALGLARFRSWGRGILLVSAGLALSAVTHALFDYCVLMAEAYPQWAWLRWFVAPILIGLCLAMDRMITRMQRAGGSGSGSGSGQEESGVRGQESGDTEQESGVREQESEVVEEETEVTGQEASPSVPSSCPP